MVSRKAIFPIAALCAALLALATHPVAAQTGEYGERFAGRTIDFELPFDTVARAKSVLEQGNDKIDPGIRALVSEGSGLGAPGFGALAKSLSVPLSAQREVAAVLSPEPGATVDDLIDEAERHDAEVSFVFDGLVFAHVPLDAVSALGGSESLYYMSRQAELTPAYPALAAVARPSDGVRSTRADRLHAEGFTGKGVRVGLLDFGFDRYRTLQSQGRVPAPAATRAFTSSGSLELGEVHGTACAEIIHAMAPDAELYLAAVEGREDQLVQAAFWLAEQGVDIVSFSGGGHVGPHDGRSLLDRLVEAITQKGILWVNAAGNEGSRHWAGTAADRDRDGWLDIGPRGENFMVIQPAVAGISAKVVWDDWGADPRTPASTQDIDAFLFQPDLSSRSIRLLAQSVNPQRGRGAPFEYVRMRAAKGRPYLLALRASNLTRPVKLHVFSDLPAAIAPLQPMGSIAIPATSPAALAVGAVDVRTDRLEDFSSQGPTDDGRLKPEVSAPDNTPSEAYALQKGRFPGTSAACPHVSGFAALLKQMRPNAGNQELRRLIVESVRPMGGRAPNYGYGHGHIDASRLDLRGSQQMLSIALPETWGGRVTVPGLDDFIDRAEHDPSLELKVAVGRSEYRLGDGLKIGYTASRGCYYLLLARDSSGKYVVVAPLEGDSPRLDGGEKYLLPEGDDVIRITEPTGVDELILIGSRDPIDISDRRPVRDVSVSRASYRVVR